MDRGDLNDLREELANDEASRDTPENRTQRDLSDRVINAHRLLDALDDLDDLSRPACELVECVTREIDGLMQSAVAFDRARRATWEDIGARLHVSKEAAWKRFGP